MSRPLFTGGWHEDRNICCSKTCFRKRVRAQTNKWALLKTQATRNVVQKKVYLLTTHTFMLYSKTRCFAESHWRGAYCFFDKHDKTCGMRGMGRRASRNVRAAVRSIFRAPGSLTHKFLPLLGPELLEDISSLRFAESHKQALLDEQLTSPQLFASIYVRHPRIQRNVQS